MSEREQHTCKAAVLHCIDFRFQQAMNGHFDKEYPEGYDLVSVAGGVKGLNEEGDARNYLLYQLKVSHDLHHPETIALIQHEDCGAYGGSEVLGGGGKELEFQRQELEKAEKLLKEQFPECRVKKYFARLSGELVGVA